MTGTALQAAGVTEIRVATRSGYSAGPFTVSDLSGLDGTCTTCGCPGTSIGGGFFWHGGGGGCYESTHFGLARSAKVHVICNADDAGISFADTENPQYWGHFHRGYVDTGVYKFGDDCVNEDEWSEVFSFYAVNGNIREDMFVGSVLGGPGLNRIRAPS
jgi:hypothetical protein